jgi:hypothetical protein
VGLFSFVATANAASGDLFGFFAVVFFFAAVAFFPGLRFVVMISISWSSAN